MPNFSSADKVGSVIESMRTAERPRSEQRALLNEFFNGQPLWTKEEAKENRITVRFNDKSGAVLLHTARSQYENALMGNAVYLRVNLPDAPAESQDDWAAFITQKINSFVGESKSFLHTQDEVFGGVVLHGIGAKMWWDADEWKPGFVGVQDLLIPTETDLTMENLQYFAVRRKMRPGELFRKTIGAGKNMRPGWNVGEVKKLLDNYKDINQNPHSYTWRDNPEQMAEIWKQNGSYYDSDAAPVIWMWDFYHLEEMESPRRNGWFHKILLESDAESANLVEADSAEKFLYTSAEPCAARLGEIIHFQFGDGNNVPPFKYSSLRSLAFLTYELLWTMNRLRCQWTQHVFEQMLTLFRVTDPNDRSRLQQIVMDSPWGIIPEGLNMVKSDERYAVDPNLVGELRTEYQSLVAKSSTSYTQDPNSNPNTEKTKFEVQAIMSSASALMGSMLRRAVKQEVYAAREICRRFTNQDSLDFDVKKFQSACKEYGIPAKWLDATRWEVEIEQKLGGGNRMMEVAEASQLMDKLNLFDPEFQTEIKRRWVLAITGNPILAKQVKDGLKITDSVHDAELAYGALLNGVKVSMKDGLNHIETVETIIKQMVGTVQEIMQSGGMGTPQQVKGLALADAYAKAHMQLIAQDPNESARVRQYGDVLGKLMNQVKAFAQRQQEAAKAQTPPGGEGKIQGKLIEAQTAAKIKEAQAAQKLAQNEKKFSQSQKQKAITTLTDIQRKNAEATAEVFHNHVRNGGLKTLEA